MGPGWVRDGDGRLSPFDIERLTRRLFRAARRLGQADPVLMRELAEAVGLFVGQEAIPGKAMPAADFIEAVARAARQLGQPAIADSWLLDHGIAAEAEALAPEEALGDDLAELEGQGTLALEGSARPLLADSLLDLSAMSAAETVSRLVEMARWARGPFHLVGIERLLASGAAAGGELASLMSPLVKAADALGRSLCAHLPGPGLLARTEREAMPLFCPEGGPVDALAALDPVVNWLAGDARRLAVVAHLGAGDGLGWRKALARLPREGRPVRLASAGRTAGPGWPAGDQPAVLGRARVNLDGESGSARRALLTRLGIAAGVRWRDAIRDARREENLEASWPGPWGLERCPWIVELRGAPAEERAFLEGTARREAGRAGLGLVVTGPAEPPAVMAPEAFLAGATVPRGGCLLGHGGVDSGRLFPAE